MAVCPWVVDFHCDTLMALMHSGESLTERQNGHLDARRLRAGNVGLQVFALFSDPQSRHGNLADALVMAELFWQEVAKGTIHPVLWREDVVAPPSGPCGMLSIEGAEPLGTDIRLLQFFFRLGVRAIGLTWNGRNQLADGVGESVSGGGLTTAGRTMVTEMNRLGMLVDVSHLSETGFWQVAEVCQGPFIASHSNSKAVCNHQRNLTDDQLKIIAVRGGVVGINFYPRFLNTTGTANSSDIVRHIEHMLTVMGRGHVGLGSDYDGIGSTPTDLPDVASFLHLQAVLEKHFGAEITAEIMGESFRALLASTLPSGPHSGPHMMQ